MAGREFSSEFIAMQKRNKVGKYNPQYGVKKSIATIKKLIKLVYVYNYEDLSGGYCHSASAVYRFLFYCSMFKRV